MKGLIKSNGGPSVRVKTPRQWVTVEAGSTPNRKMRRMMEAAERKGKLVKEEGEDDPGRKG